MSDLIIKSANIINPNEEISGVHDIYKKMEKFVELTRIIRS